MDQQVVCQGSGVKMSGFDGPVEGDRRCVDSKSMSFQPPGLLMVLKKDVSYGRLGSGPRVTVEDFCFLVEGESHFVLTRDFVSLSELFRKGSWGPGRILNHLRAWGYELVWRREEVNGQEDLA